MYLKCKDVLWHDEDLAHNDGSYGGNVLHLGDVLNNI